MTGTNYAAWWQRHTGVSKNEVIHLISVCHCAQKVMCFVVVTMNKTEEAAADISVDNHDEDAASEKAISKRQLKLQKRREEWLARKPERR